MSWMEVLVARASGAVVGKAAARVVLERVVGVSEVRVRIIPTVEAEVEAKVGQSESGVGVSEVELGAEVEAELEVGRGENVVGASELERGAEAEENVGRSESEVTGSEVRGEPAVAAIGVPVRRPLTLEAEAGNEEQTGAEALHPTRATPTHPRGGGADLRSIPEARPTVGFRKRRIGVACPLGVVLPCFLKVHGADLERGVSPPVSLLLLKKVKRTPVATQRCHLHVRLTLLQASTYLLLRRSPMQKWGVQFLATKLNISQEHWNRPVAKPARQLGRHWLESE